MKLYLLTQNENTGYDTYDSMVIAAENEIDAKMLSFVQSYELIESEFVEEPDWRNYKFSNSYFGNQNWSRNPKIELISEDTNQNEGIVCSSFNAG